MKYSSLEKALVAKLEVAIRDVTPGVMVRAYYGGRLACDIAVGHTYPYYDLASLTKVIFTQQAMMQAFDQGLWALNTKVKDILPDFFQSEMTIASLLSHTSGFDWWRPFFKDMDLKQSIEQKRRWLYRQLNHESALIPEDKFNGKALYSDLGFMTLGFILEKLADKNLQSVWQEIKRDYYYTTNLDFNLDNKPLYDVNQYAPTEECRFRNKVMRGEVHDENTWALGGISTHAGLFGSIDDVATFGLNVRSQLMGIARYKVRQKTAQLFAQRAIPSEIGDWALGYTMPSVENASCGPHFSIHSIGHTGFTGTSFWYDPRHDLLVIALSNRVNYGRENRAYVQLRPQIHTWLFEAIKRAV